MAGNATVTLYYNGSLTTFDIWMQTISTSSNNEFSSQQVRAGMSWIPIRRAQMMFQFDALWPLISIGGARLTLGYEDIDPADGFSKMNKFQDAIYSHYNAIINGSTVAPMTLTYYNNSDNTLPIYNTLISKDPLDVIQHTGWIQTVDKQYVRFQSSFTTQYTMNILTPNVANTPATAMSGTSGQGPGGITYAPTAADINAYGSGWININNLTAGTKAILKGLK